MLRKPNYVRQTDVPPEGAVSGQPVDDTVQPEYLQFDQSSETNWAETFDVSFGSAEDVQALFRESNTWDEAFDRIYELATNVYAQNLNAGLYPVDHNMRNEIDNILATIGMPKGIVANLPITAGGVTTEHEVNNLNDLIMLPYMISENELRLLTDKMLKAGFLENGTMPFGIVNAADQTFFAAWKNLLRSSINNGRGISNELGARINERVAASQQAIQNQRPTEEASLQSVAVSLLGRQLNAGELSQAMNFISSQFSYLPEEQLYLDPSSPLFDETQQTQTQYDALQNVAGSEMKIRQEGAAYLGLAQFDPRRDYGLSLSERQTFAQLTTPQSPTDLMTGVNND